MRKKYFVAALAALLVLVLSFSIAHKALAEESKLPKFEAKSALLMDFNTMQVLHEQNAKQRLPIASMTKIMTLLVIYDEIKEGKLNFEADIAVSSNASSMGGSQAFLDANSVYKASELIKSIVVASANDSCVAMAEHIAGDVISFVERMNNKATVLGLTDTYFENCTGLPTPNQYSCAYDVAVMSKHMMSNLLFFEHSKIWMYDFAHPGGRVTGLTNTNKLVRFYEGCDGGKTGFTKEALSCLSATAKRGATRLISVIIGAPDAKTRNAEISRMLNYGFANYETRQIVFKGVEQGEVNVIGGKEKTVKLAADEDFFFLTKKGAKANSELEVQINKLVAPVKSGDVTGKIDVLVNGEKVGEVNLIAMSDIGKASYLDFIDKLIEAW